MCACLCPLLDVFCGSDPLHASRWSSRSGVELVDKERGKLVLSAEGQSVVKVGFCLGREAADDVGGHGDAWDVAT